MIARAELPQRNLGMPLRWPENWEEPCVLEQSPTAAGRRRRSFRWRSFSSAARLPGGAEGDFPPEKIDPVPKPLASDPSVTLDYPIVYVRAPRFVEGHNGKQGPSVWPVIAHPKNIDPGYAGPAPR